MANVAHSTLTGSELHEPKGADTASLGTVYVADGAGSGSWASIGTSAFTGMIADFPAIEPPTGWLECDGSVISTTTYSGLFAVMAKTSSGTRTNGNAVVTSIPDTSKFKSGYYIFGTGIAAGTTILSVDSSTQITMSGNASSSGTSSFFVSPWAMNTGTITLPDFTTAGRFRRSRNASTKIGDLQADQNQAHTHSLSVSGTTSSDGAHTHTVNISDPGHTHSNNGGNQIGSGANPGQSGGSFSVATSPSTFSINASLTGITASTVSNGAHTHTVTSTGTSGSTGATESRPVAVVVLTCVKT